MNNSKNELQALTQLPCNKKQLAQEMGISLSTLQRKMKERNLAVPRGVISPQRKKEILKALDWGEMTRNDAKWRETPIAQGFEKTVVWPLLRRLVHWFWRMGICWEKSNFWRRLEYYSCNVTTGVQQHFRCRVWLVWLWLSAKRPITSCLFATSWCL